MRVLNFLVLVFPALPVRTTPPPPPPPDLSLVSDASTGPGVPGPVLQSLGVSQQLGPSCKCPDGRREGMFPQLHGERSPRQRGRGDRASSLLPPLTNASNADQHGAKNILAYWVNLKKLKNGSRGQIFSAKPRCLSQGRSQSRCRAQAKSRRMHACFIAFLAGGCLLLNPLPKASACLAKVVPGTVVSASYRCSE